MSPRLGNDHPMKFIADMHIHSHFSRATSRNLNPKNLALWAKKKGISVVGTGDFTHHGWLAELREKLIDAENGLYRLKPELEDEIKNDIPESCEMPACFLLSGEISCIYKKGGKTRKVHNLILMPDFESVTRLNRMLDRVGNIHSDGRPILGLDSRDLLEMTLEASDKAFFIPAHVWTPWFSLFGSKSGFDAIEECFEDLTPHIHALETGLSSDPPMNRLLSHLDDYLLVSNSDAHSPSKLGREANVFHTQMDYDHIIAAMKNGDGFTGTIEFYPEEGKYHLDGHRKCGIRLHPEETGKLDGICPSCGKPITVGVLHRVAELADRDEPRISKDFYSLIPLTEILSEILECGPATKKVSNVYEELLTAIGPELNILMDVPLKDIEEAGGFMLSTAIDRMRQNRVIRQEGYDGEYGLIRLFRESEKAELAGQRSLFEIHRKRIRKKGKIIPPLKEEQDDSRSFHEQAKITVQDPILDPLNSEQRSAVVHEGSHLLIVAGPGTGKTMTLSHRIAYILRSNPEASNPILALTFTNKAAGEMRRRIESLLPYHQSGKVQTFTFHGFCLDILRNDADKVGIKKDFILCSERDSSILAGQVLSEAGMGKRYTARFLNGLSLHRIQDLLDVEDITEKNDFLPLFREYHKKLRESGMLDLDDLQVETLRLFKEHPVVCRRYSEYYPKIFVDEYQDTSPIQAALLREIHIKGINEVCAIGDPDQAIYGFRGADVNHFHHFRRDFPGAREIHLFKNYRSTRTILRGAAELMGKEKPLEGIAGMGEVIRTGQCMTHAEEAEMIVEQIEKILGGTSYFSLDSGRVLSHEDGKDLGFGDIAVLFRLNAQGEAFEKAFRRAGIPFVRSGERPLISRYPADIIWRFFQTLCYPANEVYQRAYTNLLKEKGMNVPVPIKDRHIEDNPQDLIDWVVSQHALDLSSEESVVVLRRLKEFAGPFKDIKSFLDALSLDRGIDHAVLLGDRVALMTIHAAKGLEWPAVFITGCEESLMPCSLFGDYDEQEEKRLLYVGMTRARRLLVLSHAVNRNLNGRNMRMNPSPFLKLLPGDVLQPLERSKWKRKMRSHKQLNLFPV